MSGQPGGAFIERVNGIPRGRGGSTANSDELTALIVDAITAARNEGSSPPTAEQLAVRLRKTEGVIRRACAALEQRGVIRASEAVSGQTVPSYTLVPRAPALGDDAVPGIVETAIGAILRATARVFRSSLNLELRLAGRSVRNDQATTEDISIFMRVTGRLEGSLCFGLDRKAAREILGLAAKRRVGTIDQSGLIVLQTLANRVAGLLRIDLSGAGVSIDVTPASAVYPVGMKITTLGVRQSVAVLKSRYGPVVVHVVLREVPEDRSLAA